MNKKHTNVGAKNCSYVFDVYSPIDNWTVARREILKTKIETETNSETETETKTDSETETDSYRVVCLLLKLDSS